MIFIKGSYIEIDEKRCLNLMHHGVGCSHCVGHCPTEAISFYNEHVYLNKDRCSGCGLCFSDCPTEVFSSKQWDETSIIRDTEFEAWRITEFFCDKHTLPYKLDNNKDRGAVQLPACLSIISKGAWFELGLKTKIEIHLDRCKDCPMSKTIARLQYNVGTAAEWLQASGHNPAFSYIHQGSQGKTKRSWLAIETGLKVTSRRDLFVSLINKGQQLAGKLPSGANTFPKELDKKMQDSCLPGWQKRMAEVFQKNRNDSIIQAYWPTIKISEDCVNCGLCSHYCPSGTLQITVKDGKCTHHFTSGLCLDCRICELFCPRGAISRDRQKLDRPFEVNNIYSISSTQCRRCGIITANNAEKLCFWCKQGDTNDNEIKNSIKNYYAVREY